MPFFSRVPVIRRRGRRGFALLWVIALAAVISVFAAALAPRVDDLNDIKRVQDAANMLWTVAHAVDSFAIAVQRGPTRHTPRLLSELTTPIVAGNTAGCTAQTYNATAVSNWNARGPFGPIHMPASGLWTSIGRLNDAASGSTTASTPRANNGAFYYIQVPGVDVKLARMLDLMVDGNANAAADTVLYTAPAADSTVLLSYRAYVLLTVC